MSKLIEELKQDHVALTQILGKLQQVGASTPEGMRLLLDSRDMLQRHLDKEDRQMYPALRERAQTDAALRKTLETFGAEMEQITSFVGTFYKRYSNGVADMEMFRKDIATFVVTLKGRIMREEIAIYKAYDKLGI